MLYALLTCLGRFLELSPQVDELVQHFAFNLRENLAGFRVRIGCTRNGVHGTLKGYHMWF